MSVPQENDTLKFTETQRAETQRDMMVEARHRKLAHLLDRIKPLKEITIPKIDKETGQETKIVFFVVDPKLPPSILEDLLESIEGVALHSLIGSDVHLQLDPDQRKIQRDRHSIESITKKLTDPVHPHTMIAALNVSKKHIRVVGVISIDPEYAEVGATLDENLPENRKEYQFLATGIEIKSEWVDDGYQDYGIGTISLDLALEHVHNNFLYDVFIKVPYSLLAENFYSKRGLRALGERKDTLLDKNGKPVDFWFYLMAYFRKDLEKRFDKKESTQIS